MLKGIWVCGPWHNENIYDILMKKHHPSSRAERLRLKEVKNAQKLQAKEKREQRLLRKALLSKEAEDGLTDNYEGNIL